MEAAVIARKVRVKLKCHIKAEVAVVHTFFIPVEVQILV